MATINESKLKDGVIFGDLENSEFVYLPASEIGTSRPIAVYENNGERGDIDMTEALRLIRVRSLRPVKHPILGEKSC